MKTLLTAALFLGLAGMVTPVFADHTPQHKCDCKDDCSKNCHENNEKSKDCPCTHCDCKGGKSAKTDCPKCHNKSGAKKG